MSQPRVLRHFAPLLGVMALVATSIAPLSAAPPDAEQSDTYLEQGRFKVEIPGLGTAGGLDVVTVAVDPIEIDPTNGAKHYGTAKFTFHVDDSSHNKDIYDWFAAVTNARSSDRRSVAIVLLDKRGIERRRYLLRDSVPIGFAPAGSLHLQNGPCPRCVESDNLAELIIQIGSIEITDSPDDKHGPQDNVLGTSGFLVHVGDGGPAGSEDASWIAVSGGADVIDSVDTTTGSDGQHHFVPGSAYVSPIILTGYVSPNRPAMSQLILDTLAGRPPQNVPLKITPGKGTLHDPRPRVYEGCLIRAITIPLLTAGSTAPAFEEIVITATRDEHD
jgi:hypothetical protein